MPEVRNGSTEDRARHAGHDCGHGSHHDHKTEAHGAHLVKDPVCGMTVDPHTTAHRAQHGGRPYYFCAAGCRSKFVGRPGEVHGRPTAKGGGGAGRRDLHLPDASRDPAGRTGILPDLRHGPGAGPRHGRSGAESRTRRHDAPVLDRARAEPARARAGDGRAPHWASTTTSPAAASNWIQMALATPVVLWAGWPFFVRGWQSLVNRSLNMFTLIAMGTGVAWLYSVVATLAPDVFPAAFRGHDGSVAVYFEAAAVITVLVLLGQVLELRARESTGGAIRALLDLAPKTARRIRRRRVRGGGPARHGAACGTACGCVPARRCRSTARWSRAAAPSTSRW